MEAIADCTHTMGASSMRGKRQRPTVLLDYILFRTLTNISLAMLCHASEPQTILDGHLQHFDPETSGQSSNLIKAALGLHNAVGMSSIPKELPRVRPIFLAISTCTVCIHDNAQR